MNCLCPRRTRASAADRVFLPCSSAEQAFPVAGAGGPVRRVQQLGVQESIDSWTVTECDGLRVFPGGQVGDSVIMAEANRSMGQHAWRRDVALSFVGAQRDYVGQVA